MSKHMYSQNSASSDSNPKKVSWHCPVELVSAQESTNIDKIWQHALNFKEEFGAANLIARR